MTQRLMTVFAMAVLMAVTTVVSVAQQSQPTVGTGTAFIIHPDGLLMTANHVVDGAASITVSCNRRDDPIRAVVEARLPQNDLAVLRATSDLGTRAFLHLARQPPGLLAEVFTVGFPVTSLLGRAPKATEGTVTSLSGLHDDPSFLQISVPVQPGNSGGALVNRLTGEVVGVIVSGAAIPAFIESANTIPQNINWAVKSAIASTLFTLPPPNTSLPSESSDVVQRVLDSTCFVEARSTPLGARRVADNPRPRTRSTDRQPPRSTPSLPRRTLYVPDDVAGPPDDAEVTASGLASKVVDAGTGTQNPGPTSTVTVHYIGWHTNGEMFDSSVTRGQPASFPLNRVISGWTEGVQLMVPGATRRFWIPQDLAYGGRPGYPAGMLVFDVELISIQ